MYSGLVRLPSSVICYPDGLGIRTAWVSGRPGYPDCLGIRTLGASDLMDLMEGLDIRINCTNTETP